MTDLFSTQSKPTKQDYSMSPYPEHHSDESECLESSNGYQDEFSDSAFLLRRKRTPNKGSSSWFLKMSVMLLGSSTAFLGIYAGLVRAQLVRLRKESFKWNGKLGEDPGGFIPQGG
jgi:hypothetical protein